MHEGKKIASPGLAERPKQKDKENNTMQNVAIQEMTVENFLMVKYVKFTLAGKSVVIGGLNEQGKTSIVRATQALFGGARALPKNPQNTTTGEPARLEYVLTNGWRVVREGKNLTLKVYDETGEKLARGQEAIDVFNSKFALNLPAFMEGNNTEAHRNRAEILLESRGIGDQLKAIDAEIKALYEQRETHHNVYLLKKKAAEDLPFYPEHGSEPQSVSELTKKQNAVISQNRQNAKFRYAVENKQRSLTADRVRLEELKKSAEIARESGMELAEKIELKGDELEDLKKIAAKLQESIPCFQKVEADILAEIEALQKKLEEVRAQRSEQERRKAEAENKAASLAAEIKNLEFFRAGHATTAETKTREAEALAAGMATKEKELAEQLPMVEELRDESTEEISAQIEALEVSNAYANANKAKAAALAVAESEEEARREMTAELERMREERREFLKKADLPLPELSINEEYILTYNGAPWSEMATSQQFKAAIAICAETSEMGFCVVAIDRFEALDPVQQVAVLEYAEERGIQLIATRVTQNKDECSFIIQDGAVLLEAAE